MFKSSSLHSQLKRPLDFWKSISQNFGLLGNVRVQNNIWYSRLLRLPIQSLEDISILIFATDTTTNFSSKCTFLRQTAPEVSSKSFRKTSGMGPTSQSLSNQIYSWHFGSVVTLIFGTPIYDIHFHKNQSAIMTGITSIQGTPKFHLN